MKKTLLALLLACLLLPIAQAEEEHDEAAEFAAYYQEIIEGTTRPKAGNDYHD